MKVHHHNPQFQVITITIDTLDEAREFLDFIDTSSHPMGIKLSNMATDGFIEIPNERDVTNDIS